MAEKFVFKILLMTVIAANIERYLTDPTGAAIVNSQTLEEVARLEKALKSSQLSADIEGLNDNIVLDNVTEKPEDMIHDDRGPADVESNGTQEQTNTDSTSMEQARMSRLFKEPGTHRINNN
ncbi:uncharacterized protein LOC106778645 isoform X2 [Vigna radiata var. radiata]|nr:uncharacterized protein LOC106778645 isoform X2 [Vigna radiata var. radiata]